LGNKGRWEYLLAIYERYQKAERKAKKVILNEFCANTGYHRKYAIRLLNGPLPEKQLTRRERRRGLSYGPETLALLTAVWEAAGHPWSVLSVIKTSCTRKLNDLEAVLLRAFR
jgi:hypothetical protein